MTAPGLVPPESPARRASRDLAAALGTLTPYGVRYFALGQSLDHTGVLFGPPALAWETYGGGMGSGGPPTMATYSVFLVTALDDRALDVLIDLAEPVVEAIESLPEAVVRGAVPGIYTDGTVNKPCYTFTVEVSLT